MYVHHGTKSYIISNHALPRFAGGRRQNNFDLEDEIHYPTRPVDKDKAEHELVVNIKKATSPEETAPKQKHVRSTLCNRF